MKNTHQKVIYISGPMTGLPEYNYPEFHRVAKLIEDAGHIAINPANTGVQEGWEWKQYLTKDLIDLLQADVDFVVVLQDWKTSKGARLEVHVAEALEIPYITLSDLDYALGVA
jgi:hypothetical protein